MPQALHRPGALPNTQHHHDRLTNIEASNGPTGPSIEPRLSTLDVMPSTIFKMARQEHLGKALDALQGREFIEAWRLEFVQQPGRSTSTAMWWIALGSPAIEKRYETRPAERLVERLCVQHGITWKPVPHHGGENEATLVRAYLTDQAQEGRDVLGI